MTQDGLAAAAGISRSSVQKLEKGGGFRDFPPFIYAVERALGWPSGSSESVLAGRDAPTRQADAVVSEAPRPAYAEGMPLRMIRAISEGTVVETAVVDLRPGSQAKLLMIMTHADADAVGPEELRADMEEWSRVERALIRDEATDANERTD